MRINEIYYAISGEGVHAGTPTEIVRLQGCNLACSFCDSKYSRDPKEGFDISIGNIMAKTAWPHWVLITGGEPLLQASEVCALVNSLKLRDIKVEIETNGSIAPPVWWMTVDSWNADIKCPSSGMGGKSKLDWLGARPCDQVKFVVQNEEDLEFAKGIIMHHGKVAPTILISPVYPWSQEWLQKCVEFCKEQEVRLSLQLHKIIYGDRRGV
jgi:7-carboxy-7-deazaguanine synthase